MAVRTTTKVTPIAGSSPSRNEVEVVVDNEGGGSGQFTADVFAQFDGSQLEASSIGQGGVLSNIPNSRNKQIKWSNKVIDWAGPPPPGTPILVTVFDFIVQCKTAGSHPVVSWAINTDIGQTSPQSTADAACAS